MESLGSANLSDKQSGKSQDLALVVILVTDIKVLAIGIQPTRDGFLNCSFSLPPDPKVQDSSPSCEKTAMHNVDTIYQHITRIDSATSHALQL